MPAITLPFAAIVRRSAIQAKASCTVQFSQEEIDGLKDIAEKTNPTYANLIPNTQRVTVN
ncbi:MAG: hypothetical protein O3A00_23045 [Planctomycetota bacterium]|nr:hypothetical protein [Planctomycetota bacterium]